MNLDTSTEQHRHQCETRWCISKGFAWFEAYVKGVRAARNPEAAKRLWNDVRQQAALGNKGSLGEWIAAKDQA